MYGQQEINICYGDALVNQHAAFPGIQDGSFDILVANPPYSVRGFLETLPEQERQAYQLTGSINELETANSIEAFFIERAKQLLRTGGVAAIVLPSSILSNGNSVYVRAREILIQYFDIVAIAEFGSGTFGKTGTNTVTLFLRRKPTTPDTAQHYRERVAEWFRGDAADATAACIYQDEHLLARYCAHIQVPLDAYKTLLQSQPDGPWATHLESVYLEKFNASTEVATLYKAKWFKALPSEKQAFEIDKRYLAFVQAIERDKLYYFVMACDQKNPVLIIRSPTETKEQKKFLGYEWSSAKGDEGIKIIKDDKGRHNTPLYDEINRNNFKKLNSLICANFNGDFSSIPDELKSFAKSIALVDIFDFFDFEFDKKISIVSKNAITLFSKYPMKRIDAVAKIVNGGTPDTKKSIFWEGGDICWATLVDTKEKYLTDTQRKITKFGLKHTNLLPIGAVIFSSRATIGQVAIAKVQTSTNQGFKSFVCDEDVIYNEYLYYLLQYLRPVFENLIPSGSKYKELNSGLIQSFKIPVPLSIAEQKAIARECAKIDESASEILKSGFSIADLPEEISRRKKNIFESFISIGII